VNTKSDVPTDLQRRLEVSVETGSEEVGPSSPEAANETNQTRQTRFFLGLVDTGRVYNKQLKRSQKKRSENKHTCIAFGYCFCLW